MAGGAQWTQDRIAGGKLLSFLAKSSRVIKVGPISEPYSLYLSRRDRTSLLPSQGGKVSFEGSFVGCTVTCICFCRSKLTCLHACLPFKDQDTLGGSRLTQRTDFLASSFNTTVLRSG